MIDPPEASASKGDWRTWARHLRATLDWDEISEAVVAALVDWPPLRTAGTVLGFMPLPDEVNLTALLESETPSRYVTTRTPADGGLTIHELGGPMEVHRFGFLQPHATAPRVEPYEVDVWLVPGLAFDLFGTRLGRGAGYFDGLLGGARPGAFFVGVVPVELVVDQLPSEPHDQSMQYLATQQGVIEVA